VNCPLFLTEPRASCTSMALFAFFSCGDSLPLPLSPTFFLSFLWSLPLVERLARSGVVPPQTDMLSELAKRDMPPIWLFSPLAFSGETGASRAGGGIPWKREDSA